MCHASNPTSTCVRNMSVFTIFALFCWLVSSRRQWAQRLTVDIDLASNPVARCLADLQRTFSAPDGSVRAHLRRMGTAAGVEIEPAEQTALCDAVSAIPGVLFAGVPGAGGHDAIFAISLRSADVPALGLAMRAINADADASQPRVSPLNVARSDQGVTCCVTRAA